MSNTPKSFRAEVLKVVGYNDKEMYHECIDETGGDRRIDLHVNGDDIPRGTALVGSMVRIAGSHAYVEIASEVTMFRNTPGTNATN